jgi:WhiB family redox-sensing transcriptional regulator
MVALGSPVWVADDGEAFLLAIAANVPEWQRDGACVEHPDVDWFPPRGASLRPAQALCRSCLVQRECLAFALELGDDLAGVWGGTSRGERRKLLRRGVTAELVAEHGVHAVQGRENALDFAPLLDELPPGLPEFHGMGDFV